MFFLRLTRELAFILLFLAIFLAIWILLYCYYVYGVLRRVPVLLKGNETCLLEMEKFEQHINTHSD